jgi:hypothetical protein
MENSMETPQKIKIELPHDPAIPFLGIYLEEYKAGYMKALVHLCLLQHYSP